MKNMENKTKKKLAWVMTPVLALGWWAELYLWSDKGFEVDEYKGVPVTHERYKCGYREREDVMGCYFFAWPHKGTINIERYINKWQYDYILSHEFWHHLYWGIMSQADRNMWERVTDEEVMIPILKKFGYDLKPNHVSWYAATNEREDFAESYAKTESKWTSFAGIKQIVAEYYANKYASNTEAP